MNITQSFYDNLAPQYDKLFSDWQSAVQEQSFILDKLFHNYGFSHTARILDCACGIGTQAVGLAALGYDITASDISSNAISEARKRAAEQNVSIRFEQADFCTLSESFSEQFDIVIAMDNALPHMLSVKDLKNAIQSITARIAKGGLFAASIRDYDLLLKTKPPYSPPYIHKTANGQRISFQTWDWSGSHYELIQYIIEDETTLQISKYPCEYRAICRTELTDLLLSCGCSCVEWNFPEETGFYQPIVIARK